MAKAILVGPDLDEGRRFLDLLKDAGIRVRAALWRREEEFRRWELIIVTSLVDEIGLYGTYGKLIDILSKEADPAIDLNNVSLRGFRDSLAKGLHRELRNVRERQITMTPVGSEFVDEGFIYFSR
jgi:hypothetical protein